MTNHGGQRDWGETNVSEGKTVHTQRHLSPQRSDHKDFIVENECLFFSECFKSIHGGCIQMLVGSWAVYMRAQFTLHVLYSSVLFSPQFILFFWNIETQRQILNWLEKEKIWNDKELLLIYRWDDVKHTCLSWNNTHVDALKVKRELRFYIHQMAIGLIQAVWSECSIKRKVLGGERWNMTRVWGTSPTYPRPCSRLNHLAWQTVTLQTSSDGQGSRVQLWAACMHADMQQCTGQMQTRCTRCVLAFTCLVFFFFFRRYKQKTLLRLPL